MQGYPPPSGYGPPPQHPGYGPPPPPPKGHWQQKQTWIGVAIVLAVVVGPVVYSHLHGPVAKVECKGAGVSAFSCTVESTGGSAAHACWDVVAVCNGIDHRAHKCSDPVPPNETQAYVIDDVRPEIAATDHCTTVRLENLKVE